MGDPDADGGAEPVLEGFDTYNQSSTGDVSKTLSGRAKRQDAHGGVGIPQPPVVIRHDERSVSEQIDDGDLTQSLTAQFGNRGADLADGEANWLVPEQDPSLGQDIAGSLGGVGGTGGHRLDLDSSGAYVAAPDVSHSLTSEGYDASEDGTGRGTPIVPVPNTEGQELAATLKGQRGKGGGGIGPEETLLPVDEATGFYSTGGTHGLHGTEGESPALKVGSGLGIPSPPAVYSKRRNAESSEDAETWGEGHEAHTLNNNMNAHDVAADAQAVRRLTPTEAERLQGLPDGWSIPYGPSLADAPAWHDLRAAGAGRWATYSALPDQPGRDAGTKGAVELRESDTSLSLQRRDPNPADHNGGIMAVSVFHADALGRDGEAKTPSPDAEGNVRLRDAGTGITEGESYSLTAGQPHAVGFYPNQGSDSNGPGAREGESPTLAGGGGGNTPAVAYSVSGGGGETADLRASETDEADCLSTRGAWAYTQGGTLVGENAEHLDAVGQEARGFDGYNQADTGDQSHTLRGLAPGDTTTGSHLAVPMVYGGGPPDRVAFAQNQREELRELDEASSLSGQGTHQTTYVAAQEAIAFEPRYYSDRDRMGGAPSAEAGPVKATDSKAGDAAQTVVGAICGIGSGNYNRHADIGLVGPREAVASGLACPYDPPPDGPRYAGLGDAVTAPVARWIAERLVDVLAERGVIADGRVDLTADLREGG